MQFMKILIEYYLTQILRGLGQKASGEYGEHVSKRSVGSRDENGSGTFPPNGRIWDGSGSGTDPGLPAPSSAFPYSVTY
jgi:hypothetical protein